MHLSFSISFSSLRINGRRLVCIFFAVVIEKNIDDSSSALAKLLSHQVKQKLHVYIRLCKKNEHTKLYRYNLRTDYFHLENLNFFLQKMYNKKKLRFFSSSIIYGRKTVLWFVIQNQQIWLIHCNHSAREKKRIDGY